VVGSQTGSSDNEFTFAGEQMDNGGLEFLRARYYDGETGTFLSQDKLTSNRSYTYGGNSPTNYLDPSGDCRIEVRLKQVVSTGQAHIPRFNLPDWLEQDITVWHAYIYTYDAIDDSEKAYRGGPEFTGGASRGSSDSSGSDDAFGDEGLGWGKLVGQRGWGPGFADYDPDFDGPSRVVLDDESRCTSWRTSFARTSDKIDGAFEYYPVIGPNSNSFARELLDQAGLSTRKPGQRRFWTDKYWIPAWDVDLLP
jgi:RHS repeat-associated protein